MNDTSLHPRKNTAIDKTLLAAAIAMALPMIGQASGSQIMAAVSPQLAAIVASQFNASDALAKFFDNGYTYCDAQVLALYWGNTTPGDAKILLGEKMLQFGPADVLPLVEDARTNALSAPEEDLPCWYEDEGFSYADAELLARFWGNNDPLETKYTMTNLLILGQRDILQQDLADAVNQSTAGVNPPPVTTRPGKTPVFVSNGSKNNTAVLNMDMLVGDYRHEPVQNGFHTGSITRDGSGLRWTNVAGVSWQLTPDLANDRLVTDRKNPYYNIGYRDFELVMVNGQLDGFNFGNGYYALQANALSPSIATEPLQELYTIQADSGGVLAVAFSPDGRTIATGGWDNVIRTWDAATGTQIDSISLNGKGDLILDLQYSPDGRQIAAGSRDNETRFHSVNVFDSRTAREALDLNRRPPDSCSSVAYSPDGVILAAGCFDSRNGDRTVQLWNATTGQAALTIQDVDSPVSYSPNGQFITSSSGSASELKVWNSSTGQLHSTVRGMRYTSVAFSPDSRRVVGGDVDGVLKVWDINTGQSLLNMLGHTDRITSVSFDPRGEYIISASADGSVRMWDTLKGDLVALIKAAKSVESVAFSPDGSRVVAASADGIIHVHSVF